MQTIKKIGTLIRMDKDWNADDADLTKRGLLRIRNKFKSAVIRVETSALSAFNTLKMER